MFFKAFRQDNRIDWIFYLSAGSRPGKSSSPPAKLQAFRLRQAFRYARGATFSAKRMTPFAVPSGNRKNILQIL
jgi:hypothetical protein